MRYILALIIVVVFASCEFFTQKKKDNGPSLDSISFTSVDKAPSFKVCDSIFEKAEKNDCFRNTMYQEITNSLARKEIKVKEEIDEVIQVIITIHATKKISLKSIEAPQNVYVQIPDIKNIIEQSIEELPPVFPAIKRDVLVTSEYILPIRIQLKN